MVHTARLLLAAVLSFCALPVAAATAPPGAAPPDRKLMQAINDAWCTLDPDNAARYYDPSAGNVFYDVAPLKYEGWEAYARGAREMLSTLQSMTYTVGDDAVVHVDGGTAWGTATLHLVTVDRQDRRQETDLRWTPVWLSKDGRWLLVHEHLSAAMEPPAASP